MIHAVTDVLKKSHFSLQMGNCPIPVAEDSGLYNRTLFALLTLAKGSLEPSIFGLEKASPPDELEFSFKPH